MTLERYDIFISYRRDGGQDKARNLQQALDKRGYRVFFDFDELRDGEFDKNIYRAIDNAPIFILLLTPQSLDRCVNIGDWVRKEIEYAIEQQKHIILIDPDYTFKAPPQDIPNTILNLIAKLNYQVLDFKKLFEESVDKLIKECLRPALSAAGRTIAASAKGAKIHLETDLDCRILLYGKEIGCALIGEYTEIRLPKGEQKLEFVSQENSIIRTTKLIEINDLEFEKYINIELRNKFNSLPKTEEKKNIINDNEKLHLLNLPTEEIVVRYKNNLCGYRLKTSNKLITDIKYNECCSFNNDGLARVKLKGKYGCINKAGEEIIPVEYDNISIDSGDLIAASRNGKWGYLNKLGEVAIPFIYDFVWGFCGKTSTVRLGGKNFKIDKLGNKIKLNKQY